MARTVSCRGRLGDNAAVMDIRIETATESPLGPSAPAALSALDGFLGGEPIDALRQTLGLTHSGAVRLVGAAQAKKRREREEQHGAAGPMVRCATCGVFLPRTDAVRIGETFRCNDPACLPR